MMLFRSPLFLLSIGLLAAAGAPCAGKERLPRAEPPHFSEEERALFSGNGLEDLVGPRPTPQAATTTTTAPQATQVAGAKWSDWVDEEALETEIKRQAKQLSEAVASDAAYKAGRFRQAGDALGMASLLMAVTAEHDGVPRWQRTAPAAREAFANEVSDTSSDDESLAATKELANKLADLVRGSRPDFEQPEEAPADWSRYVDRGTLMRRMELADEQRLAGWVVDRRALRRNQQQVRHEAQLLALMAEALMRPGAYDADDADYRAYAELLRDAATRLAAAAELEDHPRAEESLRAIQQSCVDCHADYRG